MRKKLKWLIPLLALLLLAAAFLVFTGIYYHADEAALAALESDAAVQVVRTDSGWFFDGPSGDRALVFYPGGKVEAEAYAPLLHELAAGGVDVFLVEMPFRLAVFGQNRADGILDRYSYENWYVGGHSLGGAVAALYAADRADRLSGLVLLAAYPTKALDGRLLVLSVYGSEDGVLDPEKLEAGRAYMPAGCLEYRIEGGNHAQFGSYGAQSGDGTASISAEEQRQSTVGFLLSNILADRGQGE